MTDYAQMKSELLQQISEAQQLRKGDRAETNRPISELLEALRILEAQEAAAQGKGRRKLKVSIANFDDESS